MEKSSLRPETEDLTVDQIEARWQRMCDRVRTYASEFPQLARRDLTEISRWKRLALARLEIRERKAQVHTAIDDMVYEKLTAEWMTIVHLERQCGRKLSMYKLKTSLFRMAANHRIDLINTGDHRHFVARRRL